jgi:alkylation response protein AidB-like acyl-CoA dehydrogenase
MSGQTIEVATAGDPAAAVGSLTELIRTGCADVDATRRLPEDVIRALQDVGVFRLMAPAEIGGREVDPLTFWKVVESASYADGSAGWCVMIGGCYATFGGMLPPDAAREIYGDPATISAGAFRPDGMVVEVDGGYRLSGRWPLGSGSSHANWFVGGGIILRDGQPVMGPMGFPLVRELFFPAADTEVIDTWESTGLRGTASHDYAVADVFVPASRTVWFQEPPANDGPLYRMPPIAMFATFIGAVPLGIARHAVDEFVQLARTKTPTLASSVLADKATAQEHLGRAQALVAGGRAYLTTTLDDLWQRVLAGHDPTMEDRAALWLAATHVAQGSLAAVELLYTAAGADSVYARSALDRCLRDARTAVQHICAQEANFELAGRLLLGREVVPSVWAMDLRSRA